jgi:hypothetical protein
VQFVDDNDDTLIGSVIWCNYLVIWIIHYGRQIKY